MYQIDSDVPVPSIRRGKYPFAEMNVGDSFSIQVGKKNDAIALGTSARKFGATQTPKRRFVIRTDKAAGTVRVWRIE